MRLENQFKSNYELVSQLRQTIRIRKIKNNVMRVSWLMLGALVLYKLADYGVPYIVELYR